MSFEAIETRDWSVADAKAHEHFLQLQVLTPERGRAQAQAICDAIERVLDNAALPLVGHTLVNLRLIFWSVARSRSEALAWCVRLVASHEEDWINDLRKAVEHVRQARAAGPDPT